MGTGTARILMVAGAFLLATAGCHPRPGHHPPAAGPAGSAGPRSDTATQPPMPRDVRPTGWTIQAGAFAEVGNAQRLAARLQAGGIEAFYYPNDRRLFVVRFGDFPSLQEADVRARALRDAGVIDSWWIAPPRVIPAGRTSSSGSTPPVTPGKAADGMGVIVARTAERFVGIPYRWGGNTVVEGLDCSGFARAVYNLAGVSLPRTAAEQYRAGRLVSGEPSEGDLVFFGRNIEKITHVGIYSGDGHFVHAPKRGDLIKVSILDRTGRTLPYLGARRYFPDGS
jgi:cell wall-associated NlpC family hydrolase